MYILFTKAANKWPLDIVLKRSEGLCRVVGIDEIIEALGSLGENQSVELAEVATAYRKALNSLKSRW